MADETKAVLTKLGFDTTDIKKALEEARQAVAKYKLEAAQADQDLSQARARFAEQYSQNERRLAQTRLQSAQEELQNRLAGLSKLDSAEKASATVRINILRQTIDAQKTYLQGYDAEAQKIQVLTGQYQQLAAQTRLANAQQGAVRATQTGEQDYRFTLNRVLSGITPNAAAGVVGAVAAGGLLAELPGLLKEVTEGLFEAAKGALEFGTGIERTSQKTGIAVDELQKLSVVGAASGIDLTSLTRATKFLGAAAVGSDVADENGGTISGQKGARVLGALGISAAGKSPDELIRNVADAFKELPDGVLKSQAAVALFGRAGLDMIPFLNKGSEGFKEISESIAGFGLDTAKAEEENQKYEIGKAKFELAKNELFASMSGLVTGMAEYLSKVADTINYFLRKTDLEADLKGSSQAQRANLNSSGDTEASRILNLNSSRTLFNSRDDRIEQNRQANERENSITEGAKIYREKFKLAGDAHVEEGAAIVAFVASQKKYTKSTEDTTEEQDKLKNALAAGKDATAKFVEKFAELLVVSGQLTTAIATVGPDSAKRVSQNSSGELRRLAGNRAGDVETLQGQLANTTDAEKRVDLQTQINSLKKEELELLQKAVNIEEKRKLELVNEAGDKAKEFLDAQQPDFVKNAPSGLLGGGPKPLVFNAANIDQGRTADALSSQIGAVKALGGDYKALLEQEAEARKALNDQLRAQLQTLISNGVQTDADREKVESLTKALVDNKAKLGDISKALSNALDFDKITAGFEALAQGIAEFSDNANQVVKAVTRGFETLQKNTKFFEKLGGGTASQGEQAVFTGKDANGNDLSLSDRLQGAGTLAGGVVGSIGQISKGGVNALTGGISLGSEIGGLFGPAGSLIGGVVGAIGGGIAALFGGGKKKTEKLASDIKEQVKDTLNAINEGTTSLVDGLAELQKEREDAVKRLSGKKGGAAALKDITDSLDAQVAQLKAKQKQILDKFNVTVGELASPPGTESYVQTISQIASTLKDAADAGASTAQQIQYLNLSLDQLKKKVGSDLRSEEETTISLLQKQIDLKQQSADIDAQAANAALGVSRSLGLQRGATAGQGAAQQLRDIEAQRQKQQKDIAAQQKALDAQLGTQAELFGINLKGLSLDQQKALLLKDQLDIQTQITAETVAQIQNQQAFYANLAAGKVSVPAGVLPPGLAIPTGAGYSFGSGAPAPINVTTPQIVINYSGTADPKALADSLKAAIKQINLDRAVGRS